MVQFSIEIWLVFQVISTIGGQFSGMEVSTTGLYKVAQFEPKSLAQNESNYPLCVRVERNDTPIDKLWLMRLA